MKEEETKGKGNEVTNGDIGVIAGTVGGKVNDNGVAVNRNYKDTVLGMIFKDKKAELELYNAVNSTDYDNPDELEIV